MSSPQLAAQVPNFPTFSGHIALTSVATVRTALEAEVYQNDNNAVLLATNFVDKNKSVDLSSPGYLQIDSSQNYWRGYTQYSFEQRATFWDRHLRLVISESGNVGKAFALLALKGLFIRDEHDNTPAGVHLPTFAKATDLFLKDLVHGWPTLETLEGRALSIANYCASKFPRAAQTVELAQHLQHILHSQDLNQFEQILQKEKQRLELASSFPTNLIEGSAALINVVEELDPSGFHPPTFCGVANSVCTAHICVVARPKLGIVSLFAGTPEAKMLEPKEGLAAVAAYLNKCGISLPHLEPLTTWGGNFNRVGCGPRKFSATECIAIAKLVAEVLAAKY